jgi:class 3 adenylate cyclase/tetratricopeptide (TPR) repeat protein
MAAADPVPLSFEGFTLDPAARTLVDAGGECVSLRRSEFELLLVFVNNPGRALSRDYLLEAVAGRHSEAFDRSIDVLVGRLRRKIEREPREPKLILTVLGIGYRFAVKPRPVPLPAETETIARPPTLPQRLSEAAERRQLTVMFCDLVGSTALSAHVDPEDLREVIGAYYRCVADTIAAFAGFVAKSMGDGVLIYFGYPEAHEDDAERAVRAGRAVIDAVGRLTAPDRLNVRVGIASGLVVVGDLIGAGTAQEHGVIGEPPNLAARLQALAQPGTLVIADSTRRQIGALFEIEDLGPQQLAGFAEPQQAWRVVGESGVRSRFEALRSEATPLIGRDEELDLLQRRWQQAKAGEGRVVLVSGEPGIGKSRLCATLLQRVESNRYTRLRYFCSPHHQDSALYPFIVQLEDAAGFAREDPAAAKLEKLEALLRRPAPPDDDVAFLADLLSLPASARHPLPNLSPQRKRQRTLEAVIRQLGGLARRQPVLMVFEDAHWIDATSRELLDLIVEWVPSLPVLLIITFRPEFQPPWTGQPQVTMLVLNRLDRNDRRALMTQITGGKALPDDVVDQIADRTDGVPLFVEELTKSTLESGLLREEMDRYVLDRALPPLGIPTSLRASLLARLDRLASVRYVAQIGAAIGRKFSYELLRAVSHLAEDQLNADLARLVASELVFQRGMPPDAIYIFKHALVQDAAYDSLLRGSRQQLHAQIAEALEAHFPELMDTQPELFAQHYTEAGLVEKSVDFWGRAGRRSAARSEMAEAAAQFRKGLDQLALLPDIAEPRRHELEFWSALGAVLLALKGFAAPETGQAYIRARGLWELLGFPPEFLRIPFGLSLHHTVRGELNQSLSVAEDMLRLGRQRNDAAGIVLGHASCGRNLMYLGRFSLSRPHLEEAVALYDPISPSSHVHQIGMAPKAESLAFLGLVWFCLGHPDQALAQSNASIEEVRRLAHPPSLCGMLSVGSMLLSLIGDDATLGERADELAAVATEQGFPVWCAHGAVYRGWAKVKNGNVAEGIALLRSGLSALPATGAKGWTPYYISFLSGAYEIAGQIDEAVTSLDDALRVAEMTGERWFEAELYRRKGELLLQQGHARAAEHLYRKALSIAREQEAKLWELRATASLARLRRDQGRHAEARDLLAPVYGWFTEGFDTPDLKEATALLDALT